MNEHFVNVKVDRESGPTSTPLYMDAAVTINRSGGLAAERVPRHQRREAALGRDVPCRPRCRARAAFSFTTTSSRVGRPGLARQPRRSPSATGDSLAAHLQKTTEFKPIDAPVDDELATQAIEALTLGFDWQWGGWGTSPKFPPASTLEFLLRRKVPRMPEKTLDAMAAGGMYDLVGGGFHRYSVDQRWLVPHFEKMLYDNAQLASCYLHGWQATGKTRYRVIVEQTIRYMLRELSLEGGGFASSQDADTDVEGKAFTFTWTPRRTGFPTRC